MSHCNQIGYGFVNALPEIHRTASKRMREIESEPLKIKCKTNGEFSGLLLLLLLESSVLDVPNKNQINGISCCVLNVFVLGRSCGSNCENRVKYTYYT